MAQGQVTPRIGEDVTALMAGQPGVGDDVTALMQPPAAPEEGILDRVKRLPQEMPRILKDAASKAAFGPFEDMSGRGATVGGLTGLALAGPPGMIVGTALGATGGKFWDEATNAKAEGRAPALGNIPLRVAGETALALPPAGILKTGRLIMDKGRQIARSAIKPTLTAGVGEAQRRLGSRALASEASDEVIERGLAQELLKGTDPVADVAAKRAVTAKQLDRTIGDQPTRAARLLETVFTRGRKASDEAVMNIPGAQRTVENQIAGLEGGRLGRPVNRPGPSTRFGEPPPTPTKQTFQTKFEDTPGGRPFDEIQRALEKPPTPKVPLSKNQEPATRRRIKPDITAREAWDAAKSLDTQLDYTKPAGDLGNAVQKMMSHGLRVATKRAVPEARPLLSQYGDETALLNMLANYAQREGNKNVGFRLPTMLASGTAVASGNPLAAVLPFLVSHLDKTALQQGQRLYTAGRKAPRSAATASAIHTALREMLLRASHEEPEP